MIKKNRLQKALQIFNKYKDEIGSISNIQEANTWKAKVLDSIKIFLGKDSSLYIRFEELHFAVKRQRPKRNIPGVIDLTVSYDYIYEPSHRENFKNLVQNIIDHISLNGLQQDYISSNFLSSFSTTTIIGGLFTAATLIFFIGKFVGGTEKEREILKMESKLESEESKLINCANNNKILNTELLTFQSKYDSLALLYQNQIKK